MATVPKMAIVGGVFVTKESLMKKADKAMKKGDVTKACNIIAPLNRLVEPLLERFIGAMKKQLKAVTPKKEWDTVSEKLRQAAVLLFAGAGIVEDDSAMVLWLAKQFGKTIADNTVNGFFVGPIEDGDMLFDIMVKVVTKIKHQRQSCAKEDCYKKLYQHLLTKALKKLSCVASGAPAHAPACTPTAPATPAAPAAPASTPSSPAPAAPAATPVPASQDPTVVTDVDPKPVDPAVAAERLKDAAWASGRQQRRNKRQPA